VETIEQLDVLRNLDCEYIQGYFFSKPVNGKSAGQIILNPIFFQIKIDEISRSKLG